jgi:hypothetical protein
MDKQRRKGCWSKVPEAGINEFDQRNSPASNWMNLIHLVHELFAFAFGLPGRIVISSAINKRALTIQG